MITVKKFASVIDFEHMQSIPSNEPPMLTDLDKKIVQEKIIQEMIRRMDLSPRLLINGRPWRRWWAE